MGPAFARTARTTRRPSTGTTPTDRYKWIALANVTLGVLLATLDGSITLIAMPDIFRGIHLDPLVPANSFYLLWMILGFLVVTSVLIVSLGRLGDMYGRVKMYNLGFVIYTAASLILTVDWMSGRAGAAYLIGFRIVQGIGGACLLANAAAIITDAFPANQRGLALGINNIVGVSGMFVGLVLGGLLAPIDWRLVFLISVPVGVFGTVWAYLKLEERGRPQRASIDWLGNATFALGLILIMVSVTYGIRPYGSHPAGWGGARGFATGGMIGAAVSFALLTLLPIDFPYPLFAAVLALNGISMGMFASPNRAGVMNSLPAGARGAGGGMNQTFQNSAQVLSVGVFFTLMIIGLSSTLPAAVSSGLEAQGVAGPLAQHAAHLPPVSILFAAFLGYNPIAHLLGGHAIASMHASTQAVLTGRSFFPHLISGPFQTGL